MATLYTQQSKNVAKTWLLMGVFLVIVVTVGYFISYYYDSPDILYFAIIFSLVMNIVGYWSSDKIALKMAGAKPADPDNGNPEAGIDAASVRELQRTVENLAITAGLPKPRVFIINDASPNAFATGRNKEHAAIAVTSGLLRMMSQVELEGVIAHEMSHVGNRDILLSTVVVILVGLVTMVSDVFIRAQFLGIGGGRSNSKEGGNQITAIFMIIGVVLILLSPIVAVLIQLAISRKREFLADTDGALLTRYPEGLASALEKIQAYSQHGGTPLKHASNSTAHLYIMNPFGAKALKGLNKLFMTHPPTEERIKILRDME